MSVQIFSAGYGKNTPPPLRKSARTYAYRGLTASCFALPWRSAVEVLATVFLAVFFPVRFIVAFFFTIVGSPILLTDYVTFVKTVRIISNTECHHIIMAVSIINLAKLLEYVAVGCTITD
jgi:hypothetical protein